MLFIMQNNDFIPRDGYQYVVRLVDQLLPMAIYHKNSEVPIKQSTWTTSRSQAVARVRDFAPA